VAGYRAISVDDPVARTLLDAYFDERAAGFPAGPAAYRRAMPDAKQFSPPFGVFLVMEDDGRQVGCGATRLLGDSDVGVCFEIKHLWVSPEHRGRGLGRELLSELERRAKGFGARVIVLDTNASLGAAQGLYQSAGYQEIPAYNDNPNATHWFGKRV
jgi:ribosomal protein S18 acetylase RimI-like enzyme